MNTQPTTRDSVAAVEKSDSEPNSPLTRSPLPAAQTYVLAEVVSKMAEAAASSNLASSALTVADATYIPPGLEVLHYPEHLNTFDGFVVSGRAWGSDIIAKQVQVSIAGVTRKARIIDGLWDVFFEDGALPRYRHGTCEIVASIGDTHGSTARSSMMVELEEFAEGYVQIDERYSLYETAEGDILQVTGDLALGTHDHDRELIVLLVSDDAEHSVVVTGNVAPGWQFGEWRAGIPISDLGPGDYFVRAQLMDRANVALTHIATSTTPITI